MSTIARQLDMDRKSAQDVGRALERPVYEPRAPRARKVDMFIPFLRDCISVFSAAQRHSAAARDPHPELCGSAESRRPT